LGDKEAPESEHKLEREGLEIRRARRALEIIDKYPDYFRQLWQREEQAFKRQAHEREQIQRRGRDHDRGGWSR
jgi:hypothetical protein